ncbi:sensor histidine kinase [Actinomadura sp. NTSP31]|uniref:sensor histidine kinase n=1 Tax=Actinomadura sp. NTSP31 TaxID=1735447 RepID=UPI0035C085C9
MPSSVLQEWRSTVPRLTAEWSSAQLAASRVLTHQTEAIGRQVLLRLALVGGLGLVVVAASIWFSVRFARSLSNELRGLRGAAQHLADRRLPEVIARLRKGEQAGTDVDSSPFGQGRTREIAQVGAAFTKVQRTAIEAAVGEAELRKGISRVFINLAWRSQSLLHRQLRMLDAMERRASDPDQLEDLFRLDHLTTRMRRHAEGLVILSGSKTIRGWDDPVPVDDLLRASLAEVENYPRVEVSTEAQVSVTGPVVADVIHLLAELIENATAFSPPHTEVSVRAALAANGLAIEVVDRGVGLDSDELAAINRQLADPPEFDLADTDRLGLFVVARLATRHGIGVVLQPSAYGGVTAVVLLPMALVIQDGRSPTSHNAMDIPRRLSERPRETVAVLKPRARNAPPDRLPQPPQEQSVWTSEESNFTDVSSGIPTLAPTGDDDTDELPRRTRQKHLAPQLRAPEASQQGRHAMRPAKQDDVDEYSPEANRDLLSSLQAGWTAGRETDDESDAADEDRLQVFDERLSKGDTS